MRKHNWSYQITAKSTKGTLGIALVTWPDLEIQGWHKTENLAKCNSGTLPEQSHRKKLSELNNNRESRNWNNVES